jgi:putative peptidoglycan lipid II flippase
MGPLKHGGLALATSIASAVNVIILTVILIRRIGDFFDREFYTSLIKVTASSFIMLMSIGIVYLLMPWKIEGSFEERLAFLVVAVTVGIVTFAAGAFVLKSPEMTVALDLIKKRMQRHVS